MIRQIATVVFVAVQFTVLYCAMYLFWDNLGNVSFVGFATVFVAAYTVGASARKLAEAYIASSRRTSDKKGVLDL